MQLLLSADGDIGLYEVDKMILDNFDKLLEEFFAWKKTNCYDETLFVEFLKKNIGENSIKFIKIVGQYPNIENEYKDIKWFNF